MLTSDQNQKEIIKKLLAMDILSVTLPTKEAKAMILKMVRDAYMNGYNDAIDESLEDELEPMTQRDYDEMQADMMEDDRDEFI